jgi:hypothetical protein
VTTPIPIPDGPPADFTSILCGPWAQPSDIPETYRGNLSDGQWRTLILYASEILYHLSGRRWLGIGCEETTTFASTPAAIGTGSWPYAADWSCGCWIPGGAWFGWGYGVMWAGEHPRPAALKLDSSTTEVTSVSTAAGVLDPAAYRLSSSGYLERIDGGTWPVCGENGPTIVAAARGIAPPLGGVMACIQFVIELYKQWANDPTCAIPNRATSVSRQGITVTLDTSAFLDKGRTGIRGVDTWLLAENPKGRRRGGSVWSPDLPAGRRG